MNENLKINLKDSKRIVIKVGTSTLTYENGNLNLGLINKLAWVLADLKNQGKEVVLVTSGAIGVGSKKLGFKQRPTITMEKQAAAAIGQAELMHIYQNAFANFSSFVAQVLLTKDDFEIEQRKQNTENTLNTLLKYEIIPIINANDTISTYEIEFSDNDSLSASVACLIKADLLIILSDIDAFYTANPKNNPNAKRISYVEKITDEIMQMGGDKGSEFSIGGMKTKLQAASNCATNGVRMAILNGSNPMNISELISGADIGTIFDKE
ncbi:glutamate 5-kinase [Campylobacter sp. RM9333]|uniref:glutamate 5-kinase n=1 Tax=Campylobacter sp. RM9333 TaxID=2735731 RepID=UPI001E10B838|nr:glutamate 5-kinase [Campylobacter sp. RM9333]